MKNKGLVMAALVGLAIWLSLIRGTSSGSGGGGGSDLVLVRNKATGTTTWIYRSVLAEYLKYGEWELA